ncbi:MAG TPA: zf-HC2 domain-containing protein [Anaerolineaceae bacterium]
MSEHSHSPNCKVLLGSLSDYIDGDLQAELCAQIEEHIKNCENCRIVVNTLRKTVEIYAQTAGEPDMPEDVRERLYAKLKIDDLLHHA